jgi:cyclophilin family peptidyl-prolyl cis-trans isomerase
MNTSHAKTHLLSALFVLFLHFPATSNASDQKAQEDGKTSSSHVLIKTSLGSFKVALFNEKTPITVNNFLSYADEGFYSDTIFHRVIPGFMIQGGGFQKDMVQKATKAPIKNEAQGFIPNKRGTIAMARTNNPDSATSQFFINVENNSFLNKSVSQAGYAVFGEVVEGMDVVDNIAATQTGRRGPYGDVPTKDIVILGVSRL